MSKLQNVQTFLSNHFDPLAAFSLSTVAGFASVAFQLKHSAKEINPAVIKGFLTRKECAISPLTTLAGCSLEKLSRPLVKAIGVSHYVAKPVLEGFFGFFSIVCATILLGRTKILKEDELFINYAISLGCFTFYKMASMSHDHFKKE